MPRHLSRPHDRDSDTTSSCRLQFAPTDQRVVANRNPAALDRLDKEG
jgi:hypothetical protein